MVTLALTRVRFVSEGSEVAGH